MDEIHEMYEAFEEVSDANRGVDLDAWDNHDILFCVSVLVAELGRREEEGSECRH